MTGLADYLDYRDWTDIKNKRQKEVMQPPPKHNDQPESWNLVIADMAARNAFGTAKYGTPLQAFNGRNPAQDAYEECLDNAVYLKNMVIERNAMIGKLKYAVMAIGNIVTMTTDHPLEPVYHDLWDFVDSIGGWSKDSN